ncbi:MAG: hypothetical protein MI976_26735 [Pseudomonadales bacterium]|nr:hypothetical protein [Pseudomonadales bacterium]
MKLFKRSKQSDLNTTNINKPRNSATVASIREKLAGYQKTQGRACFIQSSDLDYLADGSIEFEAIKKEGLTESFAIPFTAG